MILALLGRPKRKTDNNIQTDAISEDNVDMTTTQKNLEIHLQHVAFTEWRVPCRLVINVLIGWRR